MQGEVKVPADARRDADGRWLAQCSLEACWDRGVFPQFGVPYRTALGLAQSRETTTWDFIKIAVIESLMGTPIISWLPHNPRLYYLP